MYIHILCVSCEYFLKTFQPLTMQCSAFQGTSFGMSYPGMEEDLNTSRILVTLALSM